MILFFFFLSLAFGLSIKKFLILGILEAIIFFIFIYKRTNKKVGTISLILFLVGVVISYIQIDAKKEEYHVLVYERKDNYFLTTNGLEKFYVYEKDHEYEIGDIIFIKGEKTKLSFSHVESSFNFQNYLNNKGVYYQINNPQINISFLTPIRLSKYKKWFLSKFDEQTGAIIKSILFGESGEGEVVELFEKLHLSRFLSSSGIYLYLFLAFLTFIFSYLVKDKFAKLTGIILLLTYGVFTFPRFVVIKFIAIQVFKWINDYLLKKKFTYLEILSISGIIFLLIDHHLIYQDGFILTYLVPIFVIFYQNSFAIKNKILKKLFLLLGVQILFIPFSLNYYHELSPLSPFLQLMMTPVMIIYGLISLITFIGIPIYPLLNGLTFVINKCLSFISPLFLTIHAPPFSLGGSIIYIEVFFITLFFLSYGFKPFYKPLILASLAFMNIYLAPIEKIVTAKVTFIDVGQGDSCLFQIRGLNVLIDTGGNIYQDLAKNTLIPYFKKEKIYDIDLLITTHNDYDHMGAASSLITNFKVKKYVTNYMDFPINIGNITLNNYNVYPYLWKEDNDASLVIGTRINNITFLITGDAPTVIEEEIVKDHPELKVDVLKVGHHGSKTSSSEAFIASLEAKEAVISCGRNNKYGHPHKEVLDILSQYNVTIRRTDLEGSITYQYFYLS